MGEDYVVLNGPEPIYEPGKGGLGFELFRSLNLHKDKIATYVIETGESCTYSETLEKSKKLAIYLRSKNLKKEDLVCLCSHNDINSSVPFFAAKFIDVGYASIEPTMPEEDLEYLFDYIKPKVLFVAEKVVDKIKACLLKAKVEAEVVVLGKGLNNLSLEKIVSETPDQEFAPAIIEDLYETAIIFFSSGTTGKPKGICCNHYSMLAKVVNLADYLLETGTYDLSNFKLKLGEDGYYNTMSYSPLYWISGIGLAVMATLHGSILTVGSTFNSDTFWEALNKYRPTLVFLPPGSVIDAYLKWKDGNCKPNDNLRLFITGGGPVRPYHMNYLREMFPNSFSLQMLGMTEASGLLTVYDIRDPESVKLQEKYPESCGQISRGTSIKIVDVDTENDCGYNQQGELRIKSKYLMNGYYKIDSKSCFDQNGWFKSGDLAYINKDNCLTIVDRLKDILLYTLYNIRPSVIEDILAKHPAVHECFVIGIPHPKDNEHPMGVVKLKETNENVNTEDLIDFVNSRVPSDRYKIRAGVRIVKEMIKTPTGKIKKVAMKQKILNGEI